ncbi:MAG: ACT domain-containing protein [Kiritimatiellae bacterium]|nr:ACT domain-containing protein [Kiritimatiellia bacterium]
MKIKQISIYSENRPGQLSAICRTLAAAGVNITTLSLADTSDFGIVRLIVDDHEKAKAVLSEKGHLVNVKDVLAVCVPDRPGGMAEVMQILDAAGADIEYSYAFAFHKGEKAVLVFRFADGDVAEKALAQAGVAMLDEKEIAEASK